jgi:hypothetical protein
MNQEQPSNWSKNNSELLANFLKSGTGELFLAHLASLRPSLISEGADLNTIALRAQKVAGYENCLRIILSLSTVLDDADEQSPKNDWQDLDAPAKPDEVKPR